jgi:hypothetical protein
MAPTGLAASFALGFLSLLAGAVPSRAGTDEAAAVKAIRELPEVRAYIAEVTARNHRGTPVQITIDDEPVEGCKSGDGECDWLIAIAEDFGDYRVGYQDFLVDSTNGAVRVALNGSDVEIPYATWHAERDGKAWRLVRDGKSLATDWRWRDDDFVARQGDRTWLSLRALADSDFQRWLKDGPAPEDAAADVGCWHTHRMVPRSVVGTLLSFDDFEEDVCGHAPHDVARRLTLEFSRPGPTVFRNAELDVDSPKAGQIVDLTSFFPAESIRAALLGKAEVRGRLTAKTVPAPLDALIEALVEHDQGATGCPGVFIKDALRRFDFERYDGGEVVVGLGLPGRGDCARSIATLELSLPIPTPLDGAFKAAATGNGGFLAKDVPAGPATSDIQVYHDLEAGAD